MDAELPEQTGDGFIRMIQQSQKQVLHRYKFILHRPGGFSAPVRTRSTSSATHRSGQPPDPDR